MRTHPLHIVSVSNHHSALGNLPGCLLPPIVLLELYNLYHYAPRTKVELCVHLTPHSHLSRQRQTDTLRTFEVNLASVLKLEERPLPGEGQASGTTLLQSEQHTFDKEVELIDRHLKIQPTLALRAAVVVT